MRPRGCVLEKQPQASNTGGQGPEHSELGSDVSGCVIRFE